MLSAIDWSHSFAFIVSSGIANGFHVNPPKLLVVDTEELEPAVTGPGGRVDTDRLDDRAEVTHVAHPVDREGSMRGNDTLGSAAATSATECP